MTARILRALLLLACSCAAVATAGPLTGPGLSSREAFELCTNSDAEAMQCYRVGRCVDELLYGGTYPTPGRFERLILVRKQEPTGVLTAIVNNPASNALSWRSVVSGIDELGLISGAADHSSPRRAG